MKKETKAWLESLTEEQAYSMKGLAQGDSYISGLNPEAFLNLYAYLNVKSGVEYITLMVRDLEITNPSYTTSMAECLHFYGDIDFDYCDKLTPRKYPEERRTALVQSPLYKEWRNILGDSLVRLHDRHEAAPIVSAIKG